MVRRYTYRQPQHDHVHQDPFGITRLGLRPGAQEDRDCAATGDNRPTIWILRGYPRVGGVGARDGRDKTGGSDHVHGGTALELADVWDSHLFADDTPCRAFHARAGDSGEVARIVGLDPLDVAEERLPGLVVVADGVPHPAIVRQPHNVDLSIHPGATDRAEVPRVVAFDGLDVAEERLPAPVAVADGMPHPTDVRDGDQVQVPVDAGPRGDSAEVAGIVGLDPLDVAEERLPGLVVMADGVPHPAVVRQPHNVQLATDPGATDRAEVPGVVAFDG